MGASGKKSHYLPAAWYFISLHKVFSRQIKPRFPLLSTRCALSERSIALASSTEKSWPTAIRDETLSAESPLSTCPLQSSTVCVARKRKQSKENRCGHPERIADSKVASRNTSSPISPSPPPFLVKRNFIVISSFPTLYLSFASSWDFTSSSLYAESPRNLFVSRGITWDLKRSKLAILILQTRAESFGARINIKTMRL